MKRLIAILALITAGHAVTGFAFRRSRRRYAGSRKHFLVTQGGVDVKPTAEDVRDAVVSVLMGGVVLDLRDVHLEERPARIELLSIMGGVEFVVPEDWRVRTDVETLMGGVEDGRKKRVDPGRPVDLVVSGRVMMGGLEVASEPHRWPGGRGRASRTLEGVGAAPA